MKLPLAALTAWMVLPLGTSAARSSRNASAASAPTGEAPAVEAGGFPKLPAVAAMVGASSDALKSVNSQASVLEARVAQAQLDNEAKLARQKAVFEEKLKVQELRNQYEAASNAAISEEVTALKANNTELRGRAKELQEGNRVMRAELRALQVRLGTARDFAGEALKAAEDAEAPELAVLRPAIAAVSHKARHRREPAEAVSRSEASTAEEDQDEHEDSDDREADEEDEEGEGGGASLLSLAARVRRAEASRAASSSSAEDAALPGADGEAASPGDLLAVLSKGVADLQREEKESEAKLKSMFLSSFKAGTRRHAALLSQQRALNSTRGSLQALKTKLEAADQRLDTTRRGLEKRLRGLGLFAQKLAHLALAPEPEVPRLMQVLPQEVLAPAAA